MKPNSNSPDFSRWLLSRFSSETLQPLFNLYTQNYEPHLCLEFWTRHHNLEVILASSWLVNNGLNANVLMETCPCFQQHVMHGFFLGCRGDTKFAINSVFMNLEWDLDDGLVHRYVHSGCLFGLANHLGLILYHKHLSLKKNLSKWMIWFPQSKTCAVNNIPVVAIIWS